MYEYDVILSSLMQLVEYSLHRHTAKPVAEHIILDVYCTNVGCANILSPIFVVRCIQLP